MDTPLTICYEFLSERTINALHNNDINTIQDLIDLPNSDLELMRGIGAKGIEEINNLLENINTDASSDQQYSFFIDEKDETPQSMVISNTPNSLEEWLGSSLKPRSAQILIEQFGLISGQPQKGTQIAKELDISRERVRQIANRALIKLKSAILSGKIDPSIHQKLQTYADRKTRLPDIQDINNTYDNAAIAHLFAKATDAYYIYKNSHLNSEWLVKDTAEMDTLVETAHYWLKSQVAFISIDELSMQSNVPAHIFRDLAHTEIKDGYISIVNGYRKDGIDRVKFIHELMRRRVKPISVHELADQLNANPDSIRNAILRIPGAVNVGNSIYALEEFGYTNKTSEELAIEYLREWGTPRPMKDIINHVLHYRVVSPNAVSSAIYSKPFTFTRFDNGYIALTEWGYESDAKKRIVFEIPTREAVLSVLEKASEPMSNRDILEAVQAKYGDKATNTFVTIANATTELEKEGLLDRLGTTTYYYKIKG